MYSNAAYMHRISVSSLDDLQKCSTHVRDFYEELECCRVWMNCNNAVRMRRISVRSWSTGAWMTSIWSPVVSTPTTGPGGSSQRKRTR